MSVLIPEIRIEGRVANFIKGAYSQTVGLTAATLQFSLPTSYSGYQKLWNKEVTFFLNAHDSKPVFRGYIKRIKENLEEVQIFAQYWSKNFRVGHH